ncbi:MAG: universal stress protein [Halobacteriaceae archaeon]
MERALVVVDDTDEHRELLREAGELAAGVDAELVLLTTLTAEEFAEDAATIERIAEMEHTGYEEDAAIEAARNFARDTAEEELGGLGVSFEAIGRVIEENEHADAVLDTAAERDCDHVFITGRRRSPTGKAIFGDAAQRVILNFDGLVTVKTS